MARKKSFIVEVLATIRCDDDLKYARCVAEDVNGGEAWMVFICYDGVMMVVVSASGVCMYYSMVLTKCINFGNPRRGLHGGASLA